MSTRKSTPQLGSTGCDRIISQYDDDLVIFYQAVKMKIFHVTRAEINQYSNSSIAIQMDNSKVLCVGYRGINCRISV